MMGAIALIGFTIWHLHESTLTEARRNVGKLGVAIAEQTSRSMQAGDLVLQDIIKHIADDGPDTVEAFKTRLASETMEKFLKERADFLPQVDAFTIIAADGKLVDYSRQRPFLPTDQAGRDYVAYFRTHDDTSAFIGLPVRNRGSGDWTSYIVRRVNSRSGEFIGLVLAAINLRYFQDFFQATSDGGSTTITLLRRDGTALASFPMTDRIGDVLPATSPWHQIVKTGPAVFTTQGVLAPGTRIVSVHPLRDYPLVIDVSVAESEALATWTRVSTVAAISTTIAVVCVGLLLRALLMQFRRLESSEAMLANRNAAMEATRQRLQAQTLELSLGRAQLAKQSTTLQAALSHMNQGILMVAADGTTAVCNQRAVQMLGLPPGFVESLPSLGALISYQRAMGEFTDDPASPCAYGFEEAMSGPRAYERTRPNGLVLEVQTVPMQGGGLVRTFTDITERRRTELRIKYLAHHDGLTGLQNRTLFQDRLEGFIETARTTQGRLAVFYLDLDGFKLINDTYGHGVGDQLLIAVAKRLRASVRDSDVVARMGGDEFAIIRPLRGAPGEASELAARLLGAVSDYLQLGEVRCVVGLSIGIAIYPDHAETTEALLRDADTALYRAKADGKRTFCMFDPQIDRNEASRFFVENDLTRALTDNQLFLDYQPIVDAKTLDVVRFEALLRWRHPTRGMVPPGEFIHIAERCGLIVPIGLWALEAACAEAMTWPSHIEVSVNLSPVQFARGDLSTQVEQILARTGLPPMRLNLEVTEGVLLKNTALVVQAMAQLRHLGIRFSLDDFGTAHAGLTYLRRFSFDILKIDKSFVQDATRQAEARAVLVAIQAIGVACKLIVVAEGVETEAELALVREVGCGQIQGYLTGRPSESTAIPIAARQRSTTLRPPRLSLVQPS